ncbi:unnamed protein product [Schistosoma rodhaini]|uniref:Phosphatidylinositol 3-kinase regulatory subunit alpha n=1 Tax=Schistosoma rodhaini TaxID=6188 RepID=A0AA85EP71_9TREM|nr:unnamed protein product [Schistosoma rodhaini]CAH8681608.1 unnamed protein product [Schistosoma rodhaini]
MTQSRPYFTYDIHPGRYTCISTFRRTPLSGEEYLDVIPGDILVVECRPQNATAPTSFLYGLNETTKHKGYFPAYCVDIREFGSLQLRSKSTDRIASTHFLPNSQSIKATNVDPQSSSQPVIPPRCKRLLNLSSPSSLLSIPYSSYSHSCTNLSVSSQDILPQQCNVSVPTLSYRCHQFVNVSVSYPLICNLCNDYIVTPRCNANRCFTCKSIFHLVCAEYSKRFEVFTCQPYKNDDSTIKSEKLTCSSICNAFSLLSSSISTTEQPLVSWNCTQVAHWLAVVGLGRFVRLFIKLNLDGNFLSEVTYDSPHLCRVADPFARESLERAILTLQGKEPTPGENLDIFASLDIVVECPGKSSNSRQHDFQLISFYRTVSCIVCNIPLLGFSHQGFQCKKCGAICHRICKALDYFSNCPGVFCASKAFNPENQDAGCGTNEVPTSLVPYVSEYFGVKLEEQKLDSNSKVPIFLTTCTEQIEKLATESFITASNNPCIQPVDMAMVYQQSALTYTLQELHDTFAHCLPLPDIEQSSTHPLDIVRFAQLMKAFLRDLPVNVIPEEYYLDFCSLANIRNIDEKEKAVHAFLESLPELHRLCLIHIFNHLGFVLNHQNKLKSYLSDSSSVNLNRSNSFSESSINVLNKATPWLMIFRQILVRPPWHLITDIAMGMDTHMRALEALFSTFVDFVSEESEYTSQTKNSEAQSHVLDSNLQRNYISFSQFEHISRYQGEKHTSSESISPYPTNVVAPTINTPPSPTSITANKKDLQNQEWYWGDITQEEVRELMTDLQDGYFLVRDASGSSSAAFTLVVRWRGLNKLNRIYHRGDYFGFTDPPYPSCRFVSELVEFCRVHPLTLTSCSNLRLIWPVSRRHKRFHGKTDILFDNTVSNENKSNADGVFACFLTESQLNSELKSKAAEINQLDKVITDLQLQSKNAIDLKEEGVRLIKGYQKIRKWLQTSLSQLYDYSYPSEKLKISPQIETLKREIDEIEKQIKINKEEVNNQSKQARIICENYANAIFRQRKLRRQAHEIRRALKDRGFKEESLSSSSSSLYDDSTSSTKQSIDNQSNIVPRNSINSHVDIYLPEEIRDRRYWFLTDATREKVEELLRDRPAGTFIVRPSATGDKLALGIRLATSVQHCLIHCVNGKYGFVENSCTYESLEDLICYYHVENLKRYNNLLNITLKYPIKLQLDE